MYVCMWVWKNKINIKRKEQNYFLQHLDFSVSLMHAHNAL